ncbi:efflux transporter outer membrane subunit, partial [Pseudoxanthomonas sp. SGD-10]
LQAAVEGAVVRLRPILMTSFAFVAGLLPLMFASGAGALGNRSIGVASVGGMLIGTVIGVLVIPGLYVLFSSKRRKKKIEVTGTVLLVFIFLSACSVKNDVKDVASPPSGLPTTYFSEQVADSLSVAVKPWRELFKDEALVKLIDTALVYNKDMRQTLHRIEQAKASLRLKKGAMLPNLDVVAEAGLRKYGFYTMDGIGNYDTNFSDNLKEDEKLPDPLPDYFVGLRTSWEIDIWGKLRNQKSAALNTFLASYEAQKLVQTELVSQIALAYYELISLDEELEVYNKNIELQKKALEVVEVKKSVGMADELGVQQFRAILFNSQAKKEEVLQRIAILQNHINFLCGRFDGTVDRNFYTEQHSLFDSLQLGSPLQLLQNRPDVRQAALNLVASNKNVQAGRLAFLPSIVLAPYLGVHSFDLDKLTGSKSVAWGLLGGLTMPVFNQRALRSQYEYLKAEYGIAFEEYEKTVLNAFKEVRDGIQAAEFIDKRKGLVVQETEATQASVTAAYDLFVAGRISYLDILTAQKSVLDTEISEISIWREELNNQVLLYKVLGGGWR